MDVGAGAVYVRAWDSSSEYGEVVYLVEAGTVRRMGRQDGPDHLMVAGVPVRMTGGRIEVLDATGEPVWTDQASPVMRT